MNAKETLELISKQWCNTQDLMKISQLGINNATKIRKQIRKELISQGYMLPKGLIPMAKVVEYLKIDIEYLKNMADNGQN